MKEQVILPICMTPTVVTYAHHAYSHCIMECEEYVGNELAKVYVRNGASYAWSYLLSKVAVTWQGDICSLTKAGDSDDTECIFVRKCKELDEITIELRHLQYSNASAVLNLILTGEAVEKCIHEDKGIYRLGLIRKKGLYQKLNNKYCVIENIDVKNPRWLKLERRKQHILSYISMDGEDWLCIQDIEMDESFQGELFLGINTNNGVNQFYEWLYSNYIQMYYNTTDGFVWLDYYNAPRKSYGFHSMHQFLDIIHEPVYEIREKYASMTEYVKWHIAHHYYMEVGLDEFYIPYRQAYEREHYWHNSLIYGYDDTKRVFLCAGYQMKLIFTELSYDDFERGVEKAAGDRNMNKVRYLPNTITFELQKEIILDQMKEFLAGENSGRKTGQIIPVAEGEFGIKIFDMLLETERGRRLVLEDTRITFILHEHALLMKNRINYLLQKEVLHKAGVESLRERADLLVTLTQKLKNTMIINQNKKSYTNEIFSMLKQVKSEEKSLFEQMIELL